MSIQIGDGSGSDKYRKCSQCGADCVPEPVESDGSLRIAFICREHGIHSVVNPFGADP